MSTRTQTSEDLERLAGTPREEIDFAAIKESHVLPIFPEDAKAAIIKAREEQPPNEALIGAIGLSAFQHLFRASSYDREALREVVQMAFPSVEEKPLERHHTNTY